MPIRGNLEDTALGGVGGQGRRKNSGPPSTQHLRGNTNVTPRVSVSQVSTANATTPPSAHPPLVHTETRGTTHAHAGIGGDGLEAHTVGRRLYAASHRLGSPPPMAAAIVPGAGTDAAASASHTAGNIPGMLTARGPGTGEMRAATSDLLGLTTRAGGAALTLLLVLLLLLRLVVRMPWAEGEEERRKADGSRHRQAGMRVPLLRSALRLVSRARAGLAAVPLGSVQLGSDLGSALPRWRWLGRRAGVSRRWSKKWPTATP